MTMFLNILKQSATVLHGLSLDEPTSETILTVANTK